MKLSYSFDNTIPVKNIDEGHSKVDKRICVVCDHSHYESYCEGLIRCCRCSHVVADLSISDEDLAQIYQRNYYFGEEYSNYLADEFALRQNFIRRQKTLQKYLDPQKNKSVIDIGCAYGFYLDIVRTSFDKHLGIDINDEGINYAKKTLGLNVVQADFPDVDLPKGGYVGCLWDTIEHLRNPEVYIERFSNIANTGSLLAITTGDIGSYVARWRKGKWRLIHPPTHIHYFSLPTLTRLLKRHGFEVVYAKSVGFQRSIDNALYRLLVLNAGKQKIYDFIPSIFKSRFFYLNLYDIMYVIARKERD
jgi:SAM-dependent methyltransferase